MTPDQVAHIMPPLPEPCMEDVPDELWGQNIIRPALFTAEQMKAYARAAVEAALSDAPQQADTTRCIEARNKLNAALHGEGAVIDSLEEAVASACHRLTTAAQSQQAEPTEAQIDAYCEAWGAAFEAEEPEAFGVTVEPLSASLRRCIVAGLRAAISAPTAVEPTAEQSSVVEPDERAPLTNDAILDAFCKTPGMNQFVQAFMAGARYAEGAHGITDRASKGTI